LPAVSFYVDVTVKCYHESIVHLVRGEENGYTVNMDYTNIFTIEPGKQGDKPCLPDLLNCTVEE
jgi:hypothetical protein